MLFGPMPCVFGQCVMMAGTSDRRVTVWCARSKGGLLLPGQDAPAGFHHSVIFSSYVLPPKVSKTYPNITIGCVCCIFLWGTFVSIPLC